MSPFKKLISVFLVTVMVLTLVPVGTAAQVGGTEPSQFTLNFEAGINYFGFPVRIEKAIADIFPGLDVYRRDGDRWVLANSEQPMPFAAYRVDVNAPMTVLLQGETYSDVSLTIPANKTTYFTLPQTDAIGIQELFGAAAKSVRVIGSGGLASSVPLDGQIQPGKVYLVVLNTSVTVTIKAEDKAPVIDDVKFNGKAVADGGTVTLTVLEGQTAEGTVTFKASDDKGLRVVKVNGEEVSGVGGEYSKKLTLSRGENPVVIEATDLAGQTTTYSFTVVVTENKAPVISEVKFNDEPVENGGTVTLTVLEGQTAEGTVTFKVTDEDLAVVKVNNATVEAEDGVYSYAFEDLSVGSHEVVIDAADVAGQMTTYSFTVVVVTEDNPPVISEVKFNDEPVADGGTVTLTVLEEETAEGTVTFKVTDEELEFVTVNDELVQGVGGEYSKKLTLSRGENPVVIDAADVAGQMTTYSFTVVVVVTEDNPPVISEVKFNDEPVADGGTVTLTVLEGETAEGTVTFKVTDEELEFVTVNDELVQGVGGEYSKKLTLSVGENVVVIDAADVAGQMTTYSFTVVVTKDTKPVIKDVALLVGNITINATNGGQYTVTVPESSPDGVLTFVATDDIGVKSVTVKVNGSELNPENDGSYVIAFDTATTYSIEITAVDTAEQDTTFAFSIIAVLDEAPEISNVVLQIADTTTSVQKGSTYTFTLLENEITSGTLTFSATDDKGLREVTVNNDSVPLKDGQYLWTFDLDVGTFPITIKAVDSFGQENTFAFTIVINKDAAPTIGQANLTVTTSTGVTNVPMSGTIAVVSTSATLNLSISDDVALSKVTVKLNGSDVTTPTIEGTSTVLALPVTLSTGPNTATVTVTDNKGQSTLSTYKFNVTVNELPLIGNISLKVAAKELKSIENGGTYTLGFVGTLPDSGTLTFTATDPEGYLRTLTVWVNGDVVWAHSYLGATATAEPICVIPLANGSNTIKIEAKDGASQIKSVQFTVSIVPDTLPEINGITLEYLVQQGVLTSTTLTTGTVTATLSSKTVSVAVDAEDQVGKIQTVQLVVDGSTTTLTGTHAPYEGTITLETGTHDIKVIVTDDAGQTASTEFHFVVTSIDELPEIGSVHFRLGANSYEPDKTGTTMHITARADYLSVATLTFSATDDHGLQTVEVNSSTLAVGADGAYTATVGPLTEGSNTIAIRVVDNAGQPREFVFYVDITIDTEPEITNVVVEYAGFNGKTASTPVGNNETLTATLSSTSATISVTATDSVGSVSSVSIFVNGSEQANAQTFTLTSPITLNTGTNTIQVVVTDDAQQTVTHTFTFIVNLDKLPEIKNAKLDIAHQGEQSTATTIDLVDRGTSTINVASTKLPVSSTLTFDASDDKNMVVVSAEVNGATVYSGTQYGGTLHAQPAFTLNDGANVIKITAKDSIGQTYEFTYTVNITKNNVPVIEVTQLKLGSTSYQSVSNGATVSYYSAGDVKATLMLKIADENPAGLSVNAKLDNATIVPNFVGDTYVFTPTLATGATHTIVVTAEDDYGQTATFTIYVVMKVDAKPVISNAKLQLTSTTITATDRGAYTATAASAPVTGTLTFNVTDDRGVESVTLKVNDATTNYTVTGTSYSAVVSLKAGSNNVEISAKDSGGNVATQTFTVTVNIPPIIKDVKVKINDSATLNLANGETKNLGLVSLDNTGTITFTIDNLEPASVTVKVNGEQKATATLDADNFTYTATFATASTITSYAISITATDDQGTSSFSATIVTATDNQPPTVNNVVLHVGASNILLANVTSTTVTLAVPADATITFTATDNIGIASISFNGEPLNVSSDNNYTATLTLNEGDKAINIIATDLAGNATTFSATVVVVKDNPPTVKDAKLTVTSSTGENFITDITGTINVVSPNATLTFTAADDISLASAKVIVNNVTVFERSLTGTETATSVPITLKTGTTNTVTITVTDSAGQEKSYPYTFTVVIDALPAISATLQTSQGNIPLSNGTSTVVANLPDQGTLVFTISDDGKVNSFKVDVNGVVLTGNPGSKSVTYSLPASINRDGNYVVQITATDDSNQVSSLTATVSRNKAPTISNVKLAIGSTEITESATIVDTASTLDGTLTFSATDDDGEITATPVVTIKKDGSTVATITSTLVDASEYNATYQFVPGTYLIEITAIDNLGTATTYKLSLRFDQDTTTPNITNVELVTDVLTLPIEKDDTVKISQTFLASGATVTFNVGDEHLDKVTVKVGSTTPVQVTSTTGKYEFGLPKTLPAGTTLVTITAKDVVEHEATFSFTLQVQAPEITVKYGEEVITADTPTIGPVKTDDLEQLSITVDSAATVEVKAVKGDSTYSSTTSQVAARAPWTIDLKELLTDSGTYTISIKAKDAAGNEDTFSFTLVVEDTQAPTLVSLKAIDTNETVVTAEKSGTQWVLHWEFGHVVASIEAEVSEPVEIVDPELAVVYMLRGETPIPYGTFVVDSSDPTKIIITPDEGNETAAELGTFTFKVNAGVVRDLAGNTNDEVTITLVVEE